MRWPLSARPEPAATSTDGRIVYAIGDIHGRLDLMLALLERILNDAADAAPPSPPLVVFLGDYVDRGPDSNPVIETLVALAETTDIDTLALKGNHEATLLAFLDDARFGPTWLGFGGGETLASYGVEAPAPGVAIGAWERAAERLAAQIPETHLRFLRSLPNLHVVGDYAFVHAGVRPGVALELQEEEDLLWIREPFLSSRTSCEKVIVHGHTPTEEPFSGRFRIGVDTGAYATSTLTAVRLEGATRAFIQVSPPLTAVKDRDSALNPPAFGSAS